MNHRIVIRRGRRGLRLNGTMRALVTLCAAETIDALGLPCDCQVDVIYTGDEQIRALNLSRRNIDSATDVLSFPAVDWAGGERPLPDPDSGRLFLGDVVISLERTAEQAEENENTFARELGYLTTHAVLHLLGFDHETEGDKAVMRAREEAVLCGLGLSR